MPERIGNGRLGGLLATPTAFILPDARRFLVWCEGGGVAKELLDLSDLGDGTMAGLSPEVGSSLAQAGAVCLESQAHAPGVDLTVTGEVVGRHPLHWETPDDQARLSWGNEIDATENGAAGIALLLARRLMGLVVMDRARHGTGFDYWLGGDTAAPPIQDAVRLEVSGIRKGPPTAVSRRVKEKLDQMRRGDATASGYAIVVEFGRPMAAVETS